MDVFTVFFCASFLIGGAEMFLRHKPIRCPGKGKWQNCFEDPFEFECQSRETINSISSEHNSYYEDRVWAFTCKKTLPSAGQCYWTPHYVNDYDEVLDFICPLGEVLSGMKSENDNYYNDRRWKFSCCRGTSNYIVDCQLSDFVNVFDGRMNFIVPDGYVLVGAFSEHQNYFEDRIWKYQYCKSK
ncbi:hemagglutinin/amebocyte aggregation factor-like [Rhinoderma darwinii]|uniref:hemagglutinin/amebocyte aggregation factor-like n=1 Tax=Rhinoderma darwinii TaxID=43563 RepID=UPI003F66F835